MPKARPFGCRTSRKSCRTRKKLRIRRNWRCGSRDLFRRQHARWFRFIGRSMQMNGFPIFSYSLENQSHSARRRFRSSFVALRLRPKTSHYCAVAAQHGDRDIADVQFDVFHVSVRTLAVFPHLIPTAGYCPVVIKQNQARRIQINVRHRFRISVANAIHQRVECGDDTLRAGRFASTNFRFHFRATSSRRSRRRLLHIGGLARGSPGRSRCAGGARTNRRRGICVLGQRCGGCKGQN